MHISRYIRVAAVCALTAGMTGAAYADVSIDTTGADSNQQVEFNNSSTLTLSNTNIVQVTNENVQVAQSGDVTADKNTSVGGSVSSGNASNSNATTTSVDVTNGATGSTPSTPVGGSGSEVGSVNTGTPAAEAGKAAGGMGGSVQGASTSGGSGSEAVLPEVGASQFVDVSALRAAWQPKSAAPAATLAKNSKMFSGAMLLTAALLSLLGAIGSAWYARRKEERV